MRQLMKWTVNSEQWTVNTSRAVSNGRAEHEKWKANQFRDYKIMAISITTVRQTVIIQTNRKKWNVLFILII